MAKKRPAARMTKGSAPRTRSRPASRSVKKAAAAPTARAPREISNDAIGRAAGQVWQRLADGGPQTLAALKKSIDAPADEVLLAVGWLAREDKLAFEHRGRSVTVSLQ